jgi:hypothetical protein
MVIEKIERGRRQFKNWSMPYSARGMHAAKLALTNTGFLPVL